MSSDNQKLSKQQKLISKQSEVSLQKFNTSASNLQRYLKKQLSQVNQISDRQNAEEQYEGGGGTGQHGKKPPKHSNGNKEKVDNPFYSKETELTKQQQRNSIPKLLTISHGGLGKAKKVPKNFEVVGGWMEPTFLTEKDQEKKYYESARSPGSSIESDSSLEEEEAGLSMLDPQELMFPSHNTALKKINSKKKKKNIYEDLYNKQLEPYQSENTNTIPENIQIESNEQEEFIITINKDHLAETYTDSEAINNKPDTIVIKNAKATVEKTAELGEEFVITIPNTVEVSNKTDETQLPPDNTQHSHQHRESGVSLDEEVREEEEAGQNDINGEIDNIDENEEDVEDDDDDDDDDEDEDEDEDEDDDVIEFNDNDVAPKIICNTSVDPRSSTKIINIPEDILAANKEDLEKKLANVNISNGYDQGVEEQEEVNAPVLVVKIQNNNPIESKPSLGPKMNSARRRKKKKKASLEDGESRRKSIDNGAFSSWKLKQNWFAD